MKNKLYYINNEVIKLRCIYIISSLIIMGKKKLFLKGVCILKIEYYLI